MHIIQQITKDILNESSSLGPYIFVYRVTLVGGRMGGWTDLWSGENQFIISPNVPKGSQSSEASSAACYSEWNYSEKFGDYFLKL